MEYMLLSHYFFKFRIDIYHRLHVHAAFAFDGFLKWHIVCQIDFDMQILSIKSDRNSHLSDLFLLLSEVIK